MSKEFISVPRDEASIGPSEFSAYVRLQNDEYDCTVNNDVSGIQRLDQRLANVYRLMTDVQRLYIDICHQFYTTDDLSFGLAAEDVTARSMDFDSILGFEYEIEEELAATAACGIY